MRKRWIYIGGEAIPADELVPEPSADYHVMGDIQPYQSMCDGSMVMGRSQHRDHLKRHGVIEIGNEKIRPQANLKGTGQRQALIDAVQQAKERYGSRHVERSISETLNRAYELRRR